jgi:hypothetical protein
MYLLFYFIFSDLPRQVGVKSQLAQKHQIDPKNLTLPAGKYFLFYGRWQSVLNYIDDYRQRVVYFFSIMIVFKKLKALILLNSLSFSAFCKKDLDLQDVTYHSM